MNYKKHLLIILCCTSSLSYANDELTMKGGLVNDKINDTQTLPKINNQKGNISLYEATDKPLSETPATMTVNPKKWCHHSDQTIKAWKQEWDNIYKGHITPGCANLYLEWKSKQACEGKPNIKGDWKPSLKLTGQGKKAEGLPNSIDAFISQKNCKNCDLELISFQCLNLDNVDFSQAKLKRVDFYATSLKGAKFNDSQIQGSLLMASDLSNANLSNTTMSDSYLSGANLKSANFEGANLNKVDLQHTNLQGANFKNANLKSVSFNGANLQGADFTGSKQSDINLNGANLQNAQGLRKRKPK